MIERNTIEIRPAVMWIAAPNQDGSGLRTFNSRTEALDWADDQARETGRSVAIYECTMKGRMIPQTSAFLPSDLRT
jgi:hypothetical protein